ncbi:alginate export protein [Marinoscillum furvescens DSM 4134]|uniref:Alginate export protein n=2 Tax=Marinoscillum furvescens TaxID=1026 RepID=A0A3D9LG58_MARFU|nr:alginate export protein [Marinoscillum furvescens DSM 4134]
MITAKHKDMNKLAYLTVLLLGLLSYNATAQFSITGEVRPRTEFRNGFKTLTDESREASFFTEQRSRLYFNYSDSTFKFKLAFQDIRFWGETPQIFKEEYGKTFISEAWGQYYFSPAFSVKVGRQIISYDNQRFLGGLEWAQQGRRHDALLFLYEKGATKLHTGLAYNQDDDVPEPAFLQGDGAGYYSVGGNYKTFQYAWYNQSFETGSLSLLAFNAGYQNPDTTVSFKQTFGLVASKKLGGLKLAGDFYYQTGELGTSKVNAMLAGINATLATPVTPLTIGVEYISGKDDDDTSSDITNFSPDFGTNHAHNGFMDYFFVGPANGNVGVTDIYLKTSFQVAGGALKAHIHEFMTGSTQLNAEGQELGKTMGTEVDLVYAKKLKGGVVWNLGYSQLFATDTMEALRGGDKSALQCWAWTMITFKPTFFTSK